MVILLSTDLAGPDDPSCLECASAQIYKHRPSVHGSTTSFRILTSPSASSLAT